MVSYSASLVRRFLENIHLLFYLIMTIGSVVLTSSIYIVAILAFDIRPISSAFSLFDLCACNKSLVVCPNVRCGEGGEVFILEIIMGDC